MVKRRAPLETDYIVVGARKTLKNQLDITKSYNFCQNRDYTVALHDDLINADLKALNVKVIGAQFKANEAFPTCRA